MTSCKSDGDDSGVEYAPEMYHSQAYEPMTQITDDEYFDYNSNPYNSYNMNMRLPVEGTIKRGTNLSYLEYLQVGDSLAWAAENLLSPLPKNDETILKEGESLYARFCQHCHGETGKGSGESTEGREYVPIGAASFQSGALMAATEGHIFHVITYGKGKMGSHASQILPEERWKIIRYVQEVLQNKGEKSVNEDE